MKTLSIISIVLLLAFNTKAQIAESVDEAKAQGVSIQHLDSTHMDGANVDSNKAAFKGRTHEFIKAYYQMLTYEVHYVQKNESLKGKEFGFFTRVYFNANGTIDYCFYNLPPGVLSKEEEALFKKSLNEFIKTYTFPMTANTPFVQCCHQVKVVPQNNQPKG